MLVDDMFKKLLTLLTFRQYVILTHGHRLNVKTRLYSVLTDYIRGHLTVPDFTSLT